MYVTETMAPNGYGEFLAGCIRQVGLCAPAIVTDTDHVGRDSHPWFDSA